MADAYRRSTSATAWPSPRSRATTAGLSSSLAHGQDRVSIALSEHSLRALGLAILTSVGADGC